MSCGTKSDQWTAGSRDEWGGGVSGRWSHGGHGGGRGKCGCQRKVTMMQWVIVALLLAVIVLQLKQMRLV